MIEELWTGLLAFAGKFIVPDWGALIGLIPLGLVAIVFFYLTWTAYRFATAAPMRRGMRRLPPVAPAGIHMPGPSFAPVLAAFGAFMLMFGMVTGGIWTYVGVVVLVITLLYWGREALRDYDQVAKHDADAPGEAAAAPAVPAGALRAPAGTPPPGVHIPPPSFRPLLVSIAMTMLVAGMIFGGWALLFGMVAVVVTGLGWLRDSRHEYAAVAAADASGHLEPGSAPDWPKATFAALAVIVAAALLLSSNIMPIVQVVPVKSGAPGASGGPAASGAGGGGAPTPVPSLPAGDVNLTAQNIAWSTTTLEGPAGRAFTIVLNNLDPVPHNVEIKDGSGASKFKGALDNGPAVTVYSVDPLPAGQYAFVCSVHPNMTGTLTLK